MARKRASSGVAAFNNWVGSIPREENFEIAMQVDTTTETWVDIDTNLLDGYAWALYGISWFIQDEATFETIAHGGAAASDTMNLQIHRNDDHENLIAYDDDDLWIHHSIHVSVSTEGGYTDQQPYQVQKPSITFSPTLRAIFYTDTNMVNIDAAHLLKGKIFYDIIKAPTAAQTKLGYIAEM